MTIQKKLIQWIGNGIFMLLIFLFVADPTNTIFGLKSPVFALLLLYSLIFFKADWKNIVYFIIPVVTVMVSFVFAEMQGNHVDMDALKDLIFSFSPLLLLMWAGHYDIIRLSVIPVTITAILVLILFWGIYFVPEFEGPVFMFMCEHDETIMMSNRAFLGIQLFCMYPKSTVAFLPVFGFAVYEALTKKRWSYMILVAILLHMFVISGTRSTMLLPLLLFGILFFLYCRNGRYVRYIVYPSLMVFAIAFVVLLTMLLMEESEPSNMVKYAHLESYKELFEANPEYLLFGQGPCTVFYSMGFRKMTMITEWTYAELLRNYGLLCIPIIYVMLLPIYKLLRLSVKYESALAIAVAVFIYLIIAGTNPLLFSSTGFMVILSAYSYAEIIKNRDTKFVH
jgi:hypothetical protein